MDNQKMDFLQPFRFFHPVVLGVYQSKCGKKEEPE